MNLLRIVFLIVLAGTFRLDADEPPAASPDTSAAITDPAAIQDHFRIVLTRPEFQESNEPDLNGRFKERLSQWFLHLGATLGQIKYASRMPAFESMLMSLLAAASVGGLLYTLARLTRRRARMDREPLADISATGNFHRPEAYDQAIQNALAAGEWRTAWLTTWRQFLARLENRQLVETDRSRTNREYLAQLCERALPPSAPALLSGMIDAYDRFIYGRRPIGEPDWQRFRGQIDEATLLLHLDDKRAQIPPAKAGA